MAHEHVEEDDKKSHHCAGAPTQTTPGQTPRRRDEHDGDVRPAHRVEVRHARDAHVVVQLGRDRGDVTDDESRHEAARVVREVSSRVRQTPAQDFELCDDRWRPVKDMRSTARHEQRLGRPEPFRGRESGVHIEPSSPRHGPPPPVTDQDDRRRHVDPRSAGLDSVHGEGNEIPRLRSARPLRFKGAGLPRDDGLERSAGSFGRQLGERPLTLVSELSSGRRGDQRRDDRTEGNAHDERAPNPRQEQRSPQRCGGERHHHDLGGRGS